MFIVFCTEQNSSLFFVNQPVSAFNSKIFIICLLIMDVQVVAVLGALSLACYAYYYFDNFHYHVTHGYAHLGYPEAQHVVGQKLLYGECWLYLWLVICRVIARFKPY